MSFVQMRIIVPSDTIIILCLADPGILFTLFLKNHNTFCHQYERNVKKRSRNDRLKSMSFH